ncbi:invasion associated locus B family protein [bacterium]|nr:invasion associated locus B family protein [bacterium]
MAQTTTTPPASDAPATAAQPATPAPPDGISMGVPDGLPDQASAAVNQIYLAAQFDDWEQRCVKTADGSDPCQLYQLVKDTTGNPVAEITIFILPPGGQAVFGASIMAPLETLLTANMRLAVDQAKAKLYPYSYCTTQGCIAKVGFTADELAALKKGKEIVLTVVPAAAPDKVVTASISLKGFSSAYQAIADVAAKPKK